MSKSIHLRQSSGGKLRVDRKAGTIANIPIISAGLTKTSGNGQPPMMVDSTTLRQVANAINAGGRVRSHITHPGLAGEDGIDRAVGWFDGAYVEGGRVYAMFHAGKYAEHTPRGNMREFLLGMAEESPADVGVSISSTDFELEGAGPTPALRVNRLDAVDWTSDPAANTRGLLTAMKGKTMNDEQIAKLREMGMGEDADPQEFYNTLGDAQKAEIDALASATMSRKRRPATGPWSPSTDGGTEGVDGERRRAAEITGIALRCGYGHDWAQKHITAGTAIDEVRQVALANIKRSPEDMPVTTHSSINVIADHNRDTLGEAVSDALAMKMGRLAKPHPRAMELRGRSVCEIGRIWLTSSGYQDAARMAPAQLASALMRSKRLDLAQATGDFPSLLADALGKRLRQDYAEYPSTWGLWAGRTTAPDFKEIKRPALHTMPTPTEIPEGDDYKFVTLTESQEVYQLKTYGNGVKFTRQMLINDDLNAFSSVGRQAGQACRRLEDDLVYAQITGNPAMSEDNVALFATGHANIGTGEITAANVSAGRVKMALQQDAKGTVLALRPAHLLVPVTIEDATRALLSSTEIRKTGDTDETYGTSNYNFLQGLNIVSDPRLDADSTSQWYLSAPTSQIDTVELAFLEGEESPVVEEEDEFDSDVRKMKVRHTVAARVIDYRGLYRSSGS